MGISNLKSGCSSILIEFRNLLSYNIAYKLPPQPHSHTSPYPRCYRYNTAATLSAIGPQRRFSIKISLDLIRGSLTCSVAAHPIYLSDLCCLLPQPKYYLLISVESLTLARWKMARMASMGVCNIICWLQPPSCSVCVAAAVVVLLAPTCWCLWITSYKFILNHYNSHSTEVKLNGSNF